MLLIPINYPSKYEVQDNVLEYREIKEMSQGGPEIGKLLLNGQPVLEDNFFGGPLIVQESLDKVVVPILDRGFFGNKFKIAIIDLITKECKVLDKKENLILLKSVNEEGVISYYNDLNNTSLKTVKFQLQC